MIMVIMMMLGDWSLLGLMIIVVKVMVRGLCDDSDDNVIYLFYRYPNAASSCSRLQTVQPFLFQPKDEDAFFAGLC